MKWKFWKRQSFKEREPLVDDERAFDMEEFFEAVVNNPNLHARILLIGIHRKHYLLTTDLAAIQARMVSEPEIKCTLN